MSVYDVVKGGGSARGAQPASPLLSVHAYVGLYGLDGRFGGALGMKVVSVYELWRIAPELRDAEFHSYVGI